MGKKRLGELSFMNTILCILTVFIHIISYPVSAMSKSGISYGVVVIIWRLSVIVVPGFIMLAGCKLFLKISKSDSFYYLSYYKGRLKRLILPYVFWFVIYYALFMYAFSYKLSGGFVFKNFALGALVYHLYFIPLLVQFDALIPLWRRIVRSISPIIILPVALIFTIIFETGLPSAIKLAFPSCNLIYNDRLFSSYLVYWLIGAYIGANYEKFKELVLGNAKSISAFFAFTAIVNAIFSYLAYTEKSYISNMNMIHIAYVLCALVFLFLISVRLGNRAYEKMKLIPLIDSLSYRIYMSHVLVLMGTDFFLEKAGIFAQFPATVIRIIVVYPVTILLCMIIEKITKISFRDKSKIKKL